MPPTKRFMIAIASTTTLSHGIAVGQEPPARPAHVASAAGTETVRQAPAVPSTAELNALRDENQRLRRTIELLQRKAQLLEQRVRELEGGR
jgi:hypothetical protein